MRESYVFYRSFYEAISELENDIRLEIYDAISEYSLNQNQTELKGIVKTVFTLIKPQLDANISRYENGRKGGRPKTKPKPNHNLNVTKLEPNVNVNVNANVNDNENENKNVNENVPYILNKLKEKVQKLNRHNRLVKRET